MSRRPAYWDGVDEVMGPERATRAVATIYGSVIVMFIGSLLVRIFWDGLNEGTRIVLIAVACLPSVALLWAIIRLERARRESKSHGSKME